MLEIALYSIGIITISGIYTILKEENNNQYKANDKNNKINYRKETEQYCSKLTIDELNEYIDSNYILNETNNKHHIYSTCNKDNKNLIVKHIGDISERSERVFNNRFSRY